MEALRGHTRRLWLAMLLGGLAAQFAVMQLATGAEYLDAPRNLHWGIYAAEQPRFLLDAEDSYDRIHGFLPANFAVPTHDALIGRSAPLHPWWGPLYVLLFAAVWRLSGSYLALRLLVPLLAGLLVIGSYLFGTRYFGRATGLLAAALLALFPVFREHSVMAFVEPISALLLGAALWAFAARRTVWAAALGSLAVLGKIDLIALYLGTGALAALWPGLPPAERWPRRHVVLSLGVPLGVALLWLAVPRLLVARSFSVAGAPSLYMFQVLAPLVLDQFFTLARPVTLAVLGLLAGLAAWGWLRCRAERPALARLLAIWVLGGVAILLVYCATPGASNNPRVLIPALPPLFLLVASGLARLPRRFALAGGGFLLGFFLLVDVVGASYQVIQSARLNTAMPAWQALRGAPRGFVLTDHYWEARVYARQPATWFENEPDLQSAVLGDLGRFHAYTSSNAIRYVVLPRDPSLAVQAQATPLARWYAALPLGRVLGAPAAQLVAPEVWSYLETQPHQQAGDYIIFTIEPGRAAQKAAGNWP